MRVVSDREKYTREMGGHMQQTAARKEFDLSYLSTMMVRGMRHAVEHRHQHRSEVVAAHERESVQIGKLAAPLE